MATRVFAPIFLFLLSLAGRAQDVRVDAVLDTSKMRIGEQVKVDLYVSYSARDKNLKILWPRIADTIASKVEVISTTNIDTTFPKQTNSTRIFQHQQITVSVYDSGYYAIPGFKFVVNDDTTHPIYTRPLLLEVHTVPTDSSATKLKDIKTVLDEPFNWRWYLPYIYWGLAILALVAAIVLLVLYFTRKRKYVEPEPPKPKIPPHITALATLERVREEAVWKEGRTKEYYSQISDAIRLYIEERFGMNALESTTDEIMLAFRSQVVDSESKDKLRQLLFLSDLVKFAKQVPVEQEHQITLQSAFDFVNGTKREEVVPESEFEVAAPAATPSAPPAPPPPVKPIVVETEKPASNQKSKIAWKKITVLAVSIIAGALLANYIVGRFTGEPSFNEAMEQISRDMNRNCPQLIDRETRLDSTSVLPGRVFQYHYTLIRTELATIDKRALLDRLEPAIFENVRKNPKLALQRENKVTMEYVYHDKDGKYLFNIQVRPQDY